MTYQMMTIPMTLSDFEGPRVFN